MCGEGLTPLLIGQPQVDSYVRHPRVAVVYFLPLMQCLMRAISLKDEDGAAVLRLAK